MAIAETIHRVGQTPATYDYTKNKDIVGLTDVYQTVAILDVPYREVGIYEYAMSMTYVLDLTNRSAYFQWRFNGGEWTEIIGEPKDSTDDIPRTYFYPVEWNGGPLYVELQARKEDNQGSLTIHFLDIMFERKG